LSLIALAIHFFDSFFSSLFILEGLMINEGLRRMQNLWPSSHHWQSLLLGIVFIGRVLLSSVRSLVHKWKSYLLNRNYYLARSIETIKKNLNKYSWVNAYIWRMNHITWTSPSSWITSRIPLNLSCCYRARSYLIWQ